MTNRSGWLAPTRRRVRVRIRILSKNTNSMDVENYRRKWLNLDHLPNLNWFAKSLDSTTRQENRWKQEVGIIIGPLIINYFEFVPEWDIWHRIRNKLVMVEVYVSLNSPVPGWVLIFTMDKVMDLWIDGSVFLEITYHSSCWKNQVQCVITVLG